MMKKISAFYSVFVGACMIGLWVMLYLSGQIIELSTRPIDITFHLVDEFTTSLLLIIGGFGLLKNKYWATKLHMFSMGMLLYSLLGANGYYSQDGGLQMTIMFSVLTVITIILTLYSFFSNRAKKV